VPKKAAEAFELQFAKEISRTAFCDQK